MLNSKQQVKQEIRVDKIRTKTGRSKSTELSVRGSTKDANGAPLAVSLSDSQSRSGEQTSFQSGLTATKLIFVPVVDMNRQPLMPTTPARARRWIRAGKATPFWKKGLFCVRLNTEPSNVVRQEVVVGIDPGSKREAYTVKSESHTYLNVLSSTVDWVKDAMKTRREMRRSRRNRKTPCRKNKMNRSRGGMPPSTKARWQQKLNICKWLNRVFPVTHYIVEDIKARTQKGSRGWNVSFGPLETGKNWFYLELKQLGKLETKQGYETKELRDNAGLKKSKQKLDDKFECHNVDSWVLANYVVGGHIIPENIRLMKIIPIRLHRRQLHAFRPAINKKRRHYGSTRSAGFKRGCLIKHEKYGLCYVGGYDKNRISVHRLDDGKRMARNVKIEDCKFLTFNITKQSI